MDPIACDGLGQASVWTMVEITVHNSAVEISADLVADGLSVAPQEVPLLMRAGEITSLHEQGVDRDAGRSRLTFFYKGKRFRIVIDANGHVIRRSTIDFGDRPLPSALRRPKG
jgi:hypothetical protein